MNMNPRLIRSGKLVQTLEVADPGAFRHRAASVLFEGLQHLDQGYGARNYRMPVEMAVHKGTLLIKTDVESGFD